MKRERTESTIRHFLTGSQAIRNPIATIVVLTLAFLFLPGQTQAQTAPTPQEQACFNAVQGKVAYNQAGDKHWSRRESAETLSTHHQPERNDCLLSARDSSP